MKLSPMTVFNKLIFLSLALLIVTPAGAADSRLQRVFDLYKKGAYPSAIQELQKLEKSAPALRLRALSKCGSAKSNR